MKSYLDVILNCFSEMDMEGLRLYLKKDYTYQEATPDVFLDKIESLFNEFKASGDTELLVYPGTCVEISCNPELIRTGYRFVGNVTGDYMSLRFITDTEDGLTVTDILDMFNCTCMRTVEPVIRRGERKDIDISDFETAGYNGPTEFAYQSELAKKGARELVAYPRKALEFSTLYPWLETYRLTAEFISKNIFKNYTRDWQKFLKIYYTVDNIFNVIDSLDFKDITTGGDLNWEENEEEAIQWVLEIEKVLMRDRSTFHKNFLSEEGEYYLDLKDRFIIYGKKVHRVGEMMVNRFLPIQSALIEKYFAFTRDDFDELAIKHPGVDESVFCSYLTQHLNARAIGF